MRKSALVVLILTCIVLIIIISFVVLERQEQLYVRSPLLLMERPVVTYIVGDAELYTGGTEGDAEWESLEVGRRLTKGDVLRTMADSSLDIRFSDRTAIRLAENTLIALNETTVRQLTLGIRKGTVFAKFEKIFKQQEFGVVTPSAVAGIRGTELVFTVDEESSTITALSGITEIFNPELPNQRLLLAFQKRTTVVKGRGPSEPEEIGQDEVMRLQQVINSIHLEKVFLVSSTILFAPDSDTILEESLPELDRVAQQLKNNDYSVRIDGHTARVGSTESMYALSVQRAERIREYLIEQGISPKRLSVEGYGGTRPVTGNETPEGRAENRRVEFVIVD
jgi:outer membrane protein OmpA-like peptidoglycan-associated protein